MRMCTSTLYGTMTAWLAVVGATTRTHEAVRLERWHEPWSTAVVHSHELASRNHRPKSVYRTRHLQEDEYAAACADVSREIC